MSVPYTADNWPIAGAMLPFPGTNTQGTHINDADSSVWAAALTEVKEAMYPRTFRASAVPHFRGVAATLVPAQASYGSIRANVTNPTFELAYCSWITDRSFMA